MRILDFGLKRACLLVLALLPCAAFAEGYTHLWWADGYRGVSAEGKRMGNVQTSAYGAAFDLQGSTLVRLGAIEKPVPYADSAEQSNAIIDVLPAATIRLVVEGVTYTCVRAAQKMDDHANYPLRLIDGGQLLHRFDILGLEFADAAGKALASVGRLEVAAWPERIHFTLELSPPLPVGSAAYIEVVQGESVTRGEGLTASWPSAVPQGVVRIEANDPREGGAVLPVAYRPEMGGQVVLLPARQWDMAADLDRLDQYPVTLTNDTDTPQTVPLVFAIEGSFQGVTGLCPMLRDAEGNPTGIPVQISKNWHRQPDVRLLYEGGWFHGVTQITVPAKATWKGELAIAYGRWGGVPGASHAQLSLIGWGGNQRWDQAAIGSFGESICYDPDVGLNRTMIDDVRPLMVRGMNDGQWEWTHNVGGGDFLVYFNAAGEKQYLSRVRTAYLSQGPNLTDVVYAGVSADGKIAARIEASTPRSEDINRAYHRVRYDVLGPVAFSRLAFYQLGADNYNDHQFTTIARGNAEGLVEEWQTERGGKRYLREAMIAEGRAPWVALLGGIRDVRVEKGAWADRAFVVRSWKARLGGKDVPEPHIAVYGTENGPHSANAELVPPPGLTALEAGDYVEADIELLILPQNAADYYGPNAALRASLEEYGGTWRVVQRLARENDLEIAMEHGKLLRALPIEVTVDRKQRADFTITGGAGYVPVSIKGLESATGHSIEVDGVALNQAVHGNDFWQATYDDATNTYAITYNIPLDGEPRTRRIVFR
jgi:hypothetical protein